MGKTFKKILLWTPRIAGIVFVLFISLFALDIFDMGLGFRGTILGLFMHLIPSILLAISIILAWRWEWVGAVAFAGWAIFYTIIFQGFEWFIYAMIAGIPLVIAILFLLDWIYRKQIHAA